MKEQGYIVARTEYDIQTKKDVVYINITMSNGDEEKDIYIAFERSSECKTIEKGLMSLVKKMKKFRKGK